MCGARWGFFSYSISILSAGEKASSELALLSEFFIYISDYPQFTFGVDNLVDIALFFCFCCVWRSGLAWLWRSWWPVGGRI